MIDVVITIESFPDGRMSARLQVQGKATVREWLEVKLVTEILKQQYFSKLAADFSGTMTVMETDPKLLEP